MRIVRKLPPVDRPEKKSLAFVGTSLDDLRAFAKKVRNTVGVALDVACLGGKHAQTKPWKGLGPGTFEIFENHNKNTYRAVYTVKFGDCVYVLHAFQKKSKSGIGTPKADVDLIEERYQAAKEDYQGRMAEKPPKRAKRG